MKTIIHYLILVGVMTAIGIMTLGLDTSSLNHPAPVDVVKWNLVVGGIIFVYFLPSYIAIRRRHTNAIPVVIFNVFLGWTLVTWVLCLISACATAVPVQVVHQGRIDHYPHRYAVQDEWGRPINYHD